MACACDSCSELHELPWAAAVKQAANRAGLFSLACVQAPRGATNLNFDAEGHLVGLGLAGLEMHLPPAAGTQAASASVQHASWCPLAGLRILVLPACRRSPQNRGSQQQLAGTLLHLASALALDRQRVLSLFSGAPRAAVAVPAALQPFGTEEALQAALEAARAAAAAGGGPDLLHTEAAVKYNAWGGEGGWAEKKVQGRARASRHSALLLPTHPGVDLPSPTHPHPPPLPCRRPARPRPASRRCGIRRAQLRVGAAVRRQPQLHPQRARRVSTGGSLAIMRASRLIAAGEEVLVAYNEDAVWQPLGARRSLLHKWGFRCCCARCKAEEGLPLSLQWEVETIAENMGDSEWPGPWRQRFRCAAQLHVQIIPLLQSLRAIFCCYTSCSLP